MSPFLQRVLVSALIIFGIWIAAFFGLRTLHAYREVREHRVDPGAPVENVRAQTRVLERVALRDVRRVVAGRDEVDRGGLEDALRNADSMNEVRLAIKLHGAEAKQKDHISGIDNLRIT